MEFPRKCKIVQIEGAVFLWKCSLKKHLYLITMYFVSFQGCGPTVVRAMVVNAAQLASYSQAKQALMGTGKHLL